MFEILQVSNLNKTVIKLVVGIIIILLMIIFLPATRSIDSRISSSFNKVTSKRTPDSSIVIINIASNDIAQLGPWPIKRSYYALLINNLTKYKVKKIGLEVFFSAKFISQSVYDNLLEREILKAGNVVLSSVAGDIEEKGNSYVTDSLSFPSPKLMDENILTGHINFIQNAGIEIPLIIKNQNREEKAFCLALLDSNITHPEKIKINFIYSWKRIKQYSLLQFFELVRNNDPSLNLLKDKIIFVGITDPQLSSAFSSEFDEDLPGIALHAIAFDNLHTTRYLVDSYYIISLIIFVLLFVVIIFLLSRKEGNLWQTNIIIILFISASYFINQVFYLQLAYSFFLIPLAASLTIEIYFILLAKNVQLKGAVDEARVLKRLLTAKEDELKSLQKELDVSSDNDKNNLLLKIRDLKENIDKLKDSESDQKIAAIKNENGEQNFYGLVYKSEVMQNVVDVIIKAAPTDATILITGESGTGKELVARAIHDLSSRKNYKFVAVNCAALTESLLESELFGHVKGAFTGAVSDKPGKFEIADKGTIFLDEIGETSESFQVKLLRVLQFGEFDKVGSVNVSKVNIRIVSATNKDLKKLINDKKFREDLFYRLNVINIHLPSLNDRKEDIEPIVKHFLKKESDDINISVAVLNSLKDYKWKGNVRELESVIKRAVVFCKASGRNIIQLNDLPEELVKSVKLNFEDLVIESLRAKNFSHSSINETAKELGNVNRTIISENYRGLSLKILCECDFNIDRAAEIISKKNDQEVFLRVKSKLETWLNNIQKDITLKGKENFDITKNKLLSKYKNLPQKFYKYLDKVIEHYLEL